MENQYKIKSNSLKPGSGRLLISEPLLQDAYFRRSVVLLIEHSEKEGTIGIMLNKPMDVRFNQIIKSSPTLNAGMYLGGPVETGNVYFLHTLGDKIDDSIEISPGLFWGGNIEQVNELISLNIVNNKNIRFFVGYSGWEPSQLEKELKLNSWAVLKIRANDIWNLQPGELWDAMVTKLGMSFNFWKKMPEDPSMN
jgi:putative transcriptional regulator